MKLKYRTRIYTFPFAKGFFAAQYKLLWHWWNIDKNNKGHFFIIFSSACYCEKYTDSVKRIELHKKNMDRASEWWNKLTKIY